jgi:hypothetical protein
LSFAVSKVVIGNTSSDSRKMNSSYVTIFGETVFPVAIVEPRDCGNMKEVRVKSKIFPTRMMPLVG